MLYEEICGKDKEITSLLKAYNTNFKRLEVEESYFKMDKKMKNL